MRGLRILAVAVGVVALIAGLAPTGAAAAPARRFCVRVIAKIGPRHAHVGDVINSGANADDCANRSERIRLKVTVQGPCHVDKHFNRPLRLPRSGGVFFIFKGFEAPCAGTYRTVAEAFGGGVLLDRSTRRSRVSP